MSLRQGSRPLSRTSSFSGRVRAWRRMEAIGPAGGLEVSGLREGTPVVLYDGPLGKVRGRLLRGGASWRVTGGRGASACLRLALDPPSEAAPAAHCVQ